MNLFISNLDARFPKEELEDSLSPTLRELQIHVFDIRKAVSKTFAILTIADSSKAQKLLVLAGKNPALLSSPSGKHALFRISRYPIDPYLLRALRKEEKDRQNPQAWQKSSKRSAEAQHSQKEAGLKITALQCGRWETITGKTVFVPYFELQTDGSLTRDGPALVARMNTSASKFHDLVMDLSSILAFAIPSQGASNALMITLTLAPKIYEDEKPDSSNPLLEMFEGMSLGPAPVRRFRDTKLPGVDPVIVSSCLTYSILVASGVVDLERRIKLLTSHRIPVTRVPPLSTSPRIGNFKEQLLKLNSQIVRLNCSFAWRFQIHALWANGLLSPAEVEHLLPTMSGLRTRSGEATLIAVLRRLNLQLPPNDAATDPQTGGVKGALNAITEQAHLLFEDGGAQTPTRDEVLVHRVTVTPTGIYLDGPEYIAANRVLRQYRAHSDCFLRVLFSDENEMRMGFDRDCSNERVLRGRFLSILSAGLNIANEHFDFLGFSHSSLRSQTCWFMRPFVHDGSLLLAKAVISQLGEFSGIRCAAKCAARIGQAFSETTSAVLVDPSIVQVYSDVKVGDYMMTDGCGTISKSTWTRLRGSTQSEDQPTSYQIRYKGAKGMLTLDTRLRGEQIRLRESMVKFIGSPSNELEICGTNRRPLPFKLNRQLIKILEDFGVSASVFEKLQEDDIQRLRLSASSRSVAVNFLIKRLSDSSNGLPTLLRHLEHIGIDATEDSFVREVLGALLQVQLREIKYRSRILVPGALTLYGISDETGWLKEGEVFVTFVEEESRKHSCLNGRVAVTRSPALHPGDVQVVQAVAPLPSSALWDLRNCVVFSQQGSRDLPSMLSGGDLDGDLYNIIYDEKLIPQQQADPAAYLPVQPPDIGRPVTVDDMANFFVDFMQNDQLGRIATLHQVFADRDGTFSANCLLLAALHSTAVDFSKTGVPVDSKKIPRGPSCRPDFMAPSASTKVEKGIKRAEEMASTDNTGQFRYFESERILGRLYRAVDENTFFQDLEDDTSSLFSKMADDNVLQDILDWVRSYVNHSRIESYYTIARTVRDYYESNLLDIMSLYAGRRTEQLTEKEVLIGTIMGRSGAGNRYQREQSDDMKARFNRDLRDIKAWMINHPAVVGNIDGDDDDDNDHDDGFVSLAAACLEIAVQEPSKLSSFGWFAAGLCVPEIMKDREVSSVYDTGRFGFLGA
ncbi:hypothetical protein A1O3_00322 [Capronia epimyces CBS 606.96]|uniref:RNA-dependent RNA polymerase n=1 Tax=Capronia epimyces CBS 606.96 TaxID=1182542 RepID=W9YFV7_9EURO|nr:uncharacterized protein A1O3_00322 [Capronia epimyces CBS 606.96]EXJ91772.1 hypothetical protein A1O3_00322 [Capronia epimyces CBS 606.96]